MNCSSLEDFVRSSPKTAAIWLEVAKEATRRGATVSIDPNVRPSLISDMDGYKSRLDQFLDLSHVIKVSDEDLKTLRPELSIEDHAALLLSKAKAELVIVTLGENGSMAFSKGGKARAPIWSPPVFGDTVGAGDSLMAGVLSILSEWGKLRPGPLATLDDTTLAQMLRFGAVVAGLNCAHKGCVPPTRPEVDAVLNAGN